MVGMSDHVPVLVPRMWVIARGDRRMSVNARDDRRMSVNVQGVHRMSGNVPVLGVRQRRWDVLAAVDAAEVAAAGVIVTVEDATRGQRMTRHLPRLNCMGAP